jgi:Lar family restriction alleviation protein
MKPCPFCNGDAKYLHSDLGGVSDHYVECQVCLARGGFHLRKAEAIAAWNTRHNPALELVQQQAEDDGLWFQAKTAPEAYLQQELRKLHRVIEEQTDDD